MDLKVRATDATGRLVTALQVTGDLLVDGTGKPQTFSMHSTGANLQSTLALPNATGVTNLSLTIKGQLSDGSTFERSVAISVPVVPAGGALSRDRH